VETVLKDVGIAHVKDTVVGAMAAASKKGVIPLGLLLPWYSNSNMVQITHYGNNNPYNSIVVGI
jgi:hypothetical protein